MPEVIPTGAPSPRTALAWDGTAWRPVAIGVDGRSEVAIGPERAATDWESNTLVFPRGEDGAVGRLLGVANYFASAGIWQRELGNQQVWILPSAVRNATNHGPTYVNPSATKLMMALRVTVAPVGETLTLEILRRGFGGTGDVVLLEGPPIAGVGDQFFILGPGVGGARHEVTRTAPYPLPYQWRIRVVHSAAGNWTYAVAGTFLR